MERKSMKTKLSKSYMRFAVHVLLFILLMVEQIVVSTCLVIGGYMSGGEGGDT